MRCGACNDAADLHEEWSSQVAAGAQLQLCHMILLSDRASCFLCNRLPAGASPLLLGVFQAVSSIHTHQQVLKARKAAAAILCSQCMRCSCVLCCLGLLGMRLVVHFAAAVLDQVTQAVRAVGPAAPSRGLHAGCSSAEPVEGAVRCTRGTASMTRPAFGLLMWQGSPTTQS